MKRKRFHFKRARVNGAGQPQEMGRMHAFREKILFLLLGQEREKEWWCVIGKPKEKGKRSREKINKTN